MEGGPNIQERDSTHLISENDEEHEVKGCFNLFCHPRGSGHRFIALIFMCFLGFGKYFRLCYFFLFHFDNQLFCFQKIK